MRGKWKFFKKVTALSLTMFVTFIPTPLGEVSAESQRTEYGVEDSVLEEMVEDHQAPEVTDFTAGNGAYLSKTGEIWYQELPDIIASYTIMDKAEAGSSGIKKSGISINGMEVPFYSKDYSDQEKVEQSETIVLTGTDIADRLKAGKNEVVITAEDVAGNSSTTRKIIGLDDTAPVITEIVIEEKECKTVFGSVIGLKDCYKSNIQITVNVKDFAASGDAIAEAVGAKMVMLKLNGEIAETVEVDEKNQALFLIPQQLGENQFMKYARLSFVVSDELDNQAEYYAVGSADAEGSLIIENKKPLVTMDIHQNGEKVSKEGEQDVFYYGALDEHGVPLIDFVIDANDEGENSGLKQMVVELNGETAYQKDFEEAELFDLYANKTSFDLSKVSTSDNYTGTVTVTDKAGNATILNLKIQKDTEGAEVGIPELTEPFAKGENVSGYRDCVTVTVRPTDGGVGAKAIEWGIVAENGSEEKTATTEVDENGKAVFSIYAPEDETYAKNIYIKAIDKLGNAGETVVLNKILLEKQEVHDKKSHITSEILTQTPYKDRDGNPLFSGVAKAVFIKTNITDTDNGISSVEWSVKSESMSYANLGGKLVIDNGTLLPTAGNWTIDEYSGFATKVSGEIAIDTSGIDANHTVVCITMTDFSGNKTTEEIFFSVDQTAPFITVMFDETAADSEYTNVYKESRTATITVVDRNFGEEQLELEITNTGGAVPEINDWCTTVDMENPTQTISTATIIFSEEGDYTVRIGGTDLAGQSAEAVNIEEFTIDKALPVITVTYANDNVKNEKYFADTQMAVIQIEERNFAKERIEITGTATIDGNAAIFPMLSGWSSSGDIHTATLTFDEDALYQFTVDYRDKAGNEAKQYCGNEFYVDTTAPKIEFMGVENESANNGVVAPEISITDSNYDVNRITIRLHGANHGSMEPNGSFLRQEQGQVYAFENFPEEQSVDDIYTVIATATDLAGNETTEELTFSVNRFGSVYVFDSLLKKVAGNYVQEEIDIRLTEVNVDSLEHDTIRVAVDTNGTIHDLEEGRDYTVASIGGNGGWHQYEYVIDKSIFAGDGRYIVTLYSKDAAGNSNANTDESKEAEISFGIDKTPPVVIPVDIESEEQYAVDGKTATVAVKDNLVLENVEIYIDDLKCEYKAEGENYIFHVPGATGRQDITIAAKDAAGNRTNYVISGVLVTTSAFIRFYNNTPLFVGSIAGVAAVSGTGIGVFIFRRKRRKIV